jgi:hypothetical protein
MEGVHRRFASNTRKEQTMLSRKLFLTSLAFFMVFSGTRALAASSRPRVGQPTPLEAPSAAMRLGPEVQLSRQSTPSGENWYRPAIAYNSQRHEYLVVTHNDWSTGRAIYGSRVTDGGVWRGWFWIFESSGKDSFQPAVVYNRTNKQYLVVWMYNANGDGSTYEIWGKILSGDFGTVVKPPFQIITWPNRSFWTPRVAWNSYLNQYLVVWSAMDTSGGFPGVPSDISSMLLSSTGDIITGRNLATSNYPQQADVTYNVARNEYLVVFVRAYDTTPPNTSNDIYGQRVTAENALIGGAIPIRTELKHQNTPQVTTNEQDRYLVVWDHEYSTTDHDIHGQLLDVDGNQVGSNIAISISTENDTHPAVAANGASGEWLVVWQRASTEGARIRGARWGSGLASYIFEVAAWTWWDCMTPAVAADIPGYLIAYEGDSTSDPMVKQHIYGRMWWPELVSLPLVLRNY